MSAVRLIFALHNHQPVGNFDGVFEEAYQTSYRPFIDVLERYPAIRFVLHTSGPLVEWLVDRYPDYIARVRAMVERGQVEILGGGFFEPIMTMIPHRDRVGQIRSFSSYLLDVFGASVRGIWIPERVWEQHLVAATAEAGIEYTVLDDFHFERAGKSGDDVFGYYLTEDDGQLLKVFPGSEELRYMVPFQEPHATYEFLRALAERRPGATVVCADDGEKFGSWPNTYKHVFADGWLVRFCDMLEANRGWLEATTFARAVDETIPLGKVYLPDCSYREMTEWVLPPERAIDYRRATDRLAALPEADAIQPFFRAGGYWRNFKERYAEADEMYARMIGISHRLAAVESDPEVDPDYLEIARQELYRGQCNCPYWHGAFGGLYLPHLRNAIYHSLISAHIALDDALGLEGPRVTIEAGDFNFDARQEVRLDNDKLIAFVRPAAGGHVYELDVRHCAVNVLATLDRRPEAYHGEVVKAAREHAAQARGAENSPGLTTSLKQPGLDRLVVYDRHPRKALVDHFFAEGTTLADLIAGRERELGDFATGTYLSRLKRDGDRVAVIMERPGVVDGQRFRLRKTIELAAGASGLSVHYEFEDLAPDARLNFAVEINQAAMAGHADDRYFRAVDGTKLGMLDERLDIDAASGLTVVDQWLDLQVELAWSQAGRLWAFPIETVSQSEGGYEGLYQSSAIIPRWVISADMRGRWEVRINWRLDRTDRAFNAIPSRQLEAARAITREAADVNA
jgi:alpha-amylase